MAGNTVSHGLSVLVSGPGCLTRPLRTILVDETFAAPTIAADADGARTLMRTRRFDVVIVATALPQADGFRLISDLRSDGAVLNRLFVALVIASGRSYQGRTSAFSTGADEVLFSPLMAGQITRKLTSLINAPRHYVSLETGYVGPCRRRWPAGDLPTDRRRQTQPFVGIAPLLAAAQTHTTGVLEA